MKRFNELHFFLDESGQIAGDLSPGEVLLVGGVLLFGPYDGAADDALHAILRRRLTESGGHYPADLHGGESDLGQETKAAFLEAVDRDVRAWAGEDRAVFGVAIVHDADLFEAGPGLLAERAYDNRYIALLWALVEHFVFVDDRVASRLNRGAVVRLHVAGRSYVFEAGDVPPEELEALGFRVESFRGEGTFCVRGILRDAEVRGMIRIALRQRWPASPYTFGEIVVRGLDYQRISHAAGVYLADLYLGKIRRQVFARRKGFTPRVKQTLLDDFGLLDYGPGLEDLARRQAALDGGDLDGFLALATAGRGASGARADHQEKHAARLLGGSPDRLVSALEDATREVDLPGRTASGLRKAETAARMLRLAGASDLRSEVLRAQVRISNANHTGDIAASESAWTEYLALESRLPTLGAEGLRLKTEIRNRRAVGLMDRFRFDEAIGVLVEIGSVQEDLLEAVARQFGLGADALPGAELGACYGSLGQAYAFLGTEEGRSQAAPAFRRALDLSTERQGQERQLVYLGHLACEGGAGGQDLWRQVATALTELNVPRPVARDGGQYVLALQVKGVLTFAETEALLRFLGSWAEADPLASYPAEALAHHPFGNVSQALALCEARAWRETKEDAYRVAALGHFDRAEKHYRGGGPLLRLLGIVCRLRKSLFEAEVSPGAGAISQKLGDIRVILRAHLIEHFGPSAWGRDDSGKSTGHFGSRDLGGNASAVDRARRLVEAVRFNYW